MKELEVVEVSEEEKNEYYERVNLKDGVFKLSHMREDPVKFSKFMLGLGVRDYQMKLFNMIDEFDKLAVVKGRQIGFSTAIAIYCLWFAWFNKHPSGIHNNTKIGIISKDDDAAKKVLQMIKDFMYQGDSHMSNFLRDKFVTGPDGKKERVKNHNLFSCKIDQSNVDVLKIKTGNGKSSAISSIHSFPPTGKARGHSFDLVFIDEAAFLNCPNPSNYFNTVIMPTISETNGKVVVSSTPNGYSGLFYDLIDPDNKSSNNVFARYSFPYTVRTDDNYLKEVEYLKQKLNLSEFMQEYCCDFTQNDISFFDSKKIKEMFDENISNINMDNHEWICGIDYGMTEARTVVTLTTEIEGVITRGYFKEFEAGWNNNNLIPFLENLKDRFRINKFIVDNCPQGDSYNKKMIEMGWNVELFDFHTQKIEAFCSLRSKINYGLVKMIYDKDTEQQFLEMQQEESKMGKLMIHKPRYGRDDICDSMVMSALPFLNNNKAKIGVYLV